MKAPKIFGGLSLIALSLLASQNTYAKGLGQQSLEEIVVTGVKQDGSLTSPSSAQARSILETIPGGIGFVDVADYEDNFTQSLGDTLVFTPGVFADTSAQRENRISIRGSGLSATFERRGINVYRDGVPISRASGITEFQEVDPLSVKYIEVLKGGNGVRFGTNALGGAVNIVTPTGANTEAGSKVRVEAGSFDSTRINASTSGKSGNIDYYAAVTKLDSDGFRVQSEVDSIYGFANIGIQLNDRVETRFYLTSLNDQFELAGSVSLEDALENPETAISTGFFAGTPFNSIGDDNDRNLKVNRLSNRTVIDFDTWQLETGAWYADRELDHAITRFAGIIVQDETELGVSVRASNERSVDSGLIWSFGATYNESQNDALVFFNDFGQRGALRDNDDQDAENFSIYGQLNIPLSESLQLVAGLQYQNTVRENENLFVGGDDDNGSISYNEYSPTVGLLWNVAENFQVYTNLNQANEAPGITDITTTGISDFQALDVQESTTFEIGTRGQTENWSWDVSLYRSEIEDELIDFTIPFAFFTLSQTNNSTSDTVHQGIEAGVDWSPTIRFLNDKGINLTWRHVLTVNDFRFKNNETFGNNKLAGVPDFNYLTELNLLHKKWKLAANVRYVDNGPFADFANTVQTEGYTLVELNGSYNINDDIRLFFSVENLTDEVYISNVSTVGSGDVDDQIFTPGQGRGYFAGFDVSF